MKKIQYAKEGTKLRQKYGYITAAHNLKEGDDDV